MRTALAFLGLAVFLSGLTCLIWAGFFGGPPWAFVWGVLGLPACFLFSSERP